MMSLQAHRGERGFAMVMGVIIIAVMATLAALVLTNGSHADRASGRGENWNAALHVAEAGVERAMASVQEYYVQNGGPLASPVSFTGEVKEGTYAVRMVPLGRGRYQVDAVGQVGTVASLERARGLRVVLGPSPSFKYALFSLTDVTTKNNNYVTGDIWANGSVTVYNGDTVEGSVNAATGYAYLQQNSIVTGDVWTGGYNASGNSIVLENNAAVKGVAKAASTTPGCTDDPGRFRYNIFNNGSITGSTTLWGNHFGSGSTGTLQTGKCLAAPVTKTMPAFSYNPLNYDPAPSEYASVSAFMTWLKTGSNKQQFQGVHYVQGPGVIDLNGVRVVDDAAVIATGAKIYAEGAQGLSDLNDGADKVLVLATWYTPPAGSACTDNGGNPSDGCAIGIKNNFQPNGQTATLLYAPNGPCAFKNNADFFGAVYCNNIVLKNNMDLTYDARVEQVVGFGESTLQVEQWLERPVDELDVSS
jgi:hypothetical protein